MRKYENIEALPPIYGKSVYFDAGLILTPITTKKVKKVIVYIDFGIKHSSKSLYGLAANICQRRLPAHARLVCDS
jgi:hypothetical protein